MQLDLKVRSWSSYPDAEAFVDKEETGSDCSIVCYREYG